MSKASNVPTQESINFDPNQPRPNLRRRTTTKKKAPDMSPNKLSLVRNKTVSHPSAGKSNVKFKSGKKEALQEMRMAPSIIESSKQHDDNATESLRSDKSLVCDSEHMKFYEDIRGSREKLLTEAELDLGPERSDLGSGRIMKSF